MSLKSSTKTDVNTTELLIEIDAAAFEKAVEAAYQRQKKNITLPGFRKGKVSRKMAEKQFGEGVFYEVLIIIQRQFLNLLRLKSVHREQFAAADVMTA